MNRPLNRPHASWRHLRALRHSLSQPNWYRDERLWSYLVASLLCERPDVLAPLFSDGTVTAAMSVYCEAEPLSARPKEGNTVVDIAFGHVKGRSASGDAHVAIEYGPDGPDSWVCFVEAKFLSDLGYRVTNDPTRNQLTRNIENLLCLQSAGRAPSRLHFVLLTPRVFRRRPTSRFYGYKFRDYSDNPQAIIDDIDGCQMLRRARDGYGWPDVPERLKALADLRWVTFEDVLEQAGFPPAHDLLVAQDHAFGHRVQSELHRLLSEEPQGH